MLITLLPFLVCPVTRSELTPAMLSFSRKLYIGIEKEVIWDGILYAQNGWFYPIIDGIPRLQAEAFLDYETFLRNKMPDYRERKKNLLAAHKDFLDYVVKKNKRTKESFELEWSLFDYKSDKTWELKGEDLLNRFLAETNETKDGLKGKLIFDAGCGNGQLNQYIAKSGAIVIGMDFSKSIERAYNENQEENAHFLQGDIQFPPLRFNQFDIVHSSGVLICTNNTERSFACIETCVKKEGLLSVWLYHPRKNFIHNLFNFIRRFTSKLPLKFQYNLYRFTIFPVSFLVKRLKGNRQNTREMMVSIMDWFSPEYRWEHTHEEAAGWFYKRDYKNVKITTTDTFGFNIIGIKK